MKIVMKLTAVALAFGTLAAAACSSCTPQTPPANDSAATQQQSYTCGKNTHLVGTQCVGDK